MKNFTNFFEKNSRIHNYLSRKFMAFAILITFSTNGFASSGLFDAYAIFSINSGANTYRQYTAIQNWSIGSFTYGSSSLILNGAQNKTFKNGGSNVTGGQIAYRVYLTSAGPTGVPFSFIQLSFGENYGTPGDQRWETNNANVNLLAGRNVGSYTFEAYFQAYTSDGDSYYTNSGLNYKATFSITAATPSITTPPTATSIALGQTLASSILSGGLVANSLSGNFAFTTPGTTPSAGTASQGVTFTPTDIANYNTATTSTNVTVSDTTTYTTSWDYGTPTASLNAVIAGDFTSGSFTAKSLTVNTTKTLTVTTGTSVTVAEALVNNGTITVENNANLIQTSLTATNSGSGTATVTRNSNALKRLDYTMWSSPVTAQNLLAFSPLTSAVSPIRFYLYNPLSNLYVTVNPQENSFLIGRGYLIRMPNEKPGSLGLSTPYYLGTETLAYLGVFTGTLNNGPIDLTPLTADKYISVGNPYPSTIDADAFLSGNETDGVLYFWRKTNLAVGTAYATYTAALGGAAGASGITPNGTIQVGQGFIVKASSTSLSFTNAMREIAPTSTQFLKTKKVADKSRLWLDLSTATGRINQVLIGYLASATVGFDPGIDGKYFNDSKIALTSIVEGEEYVIQGRPTFDATDVVALGFKTDVAGAYTIALNSFDGLFAAGQDIYLVDAVAGKEIDLKTGSYSFTATAAVDNTRFSLKYQKTLSIEGQEISDNSVIVYKNSGVIYVNSGAKMMNNIKVFDIQGRLITEQKSVKANTTSIQNLKASNQVLIVNVTTDDNQVISKKVEN
jgi:hypothetical protein